MGRKARIDDEYGNNYFGPEQEKAVVDYLTCENHHEKERIFREKLQEPLEKMVSCIIRRYGYKFGSETYEETFYDTLSDLIPKLSKFNVNGNKKAYSYYGTICRNYLKNRFKTKVKKDEAMPTSDVSEDMYNNDLKHSESMDGEDSMAKEIMEELTRHMKVMLKHPEQYMLKEKEIKVGTALVNFFENWDYVVSTQCSDKLNKNAVLLFLKESTKMDAKTIHSSLKKFRTEYLLVRYGMLNS